MDVVMDLSQKVSVMHNGELIAEGTPDEVKADEFVQKVYLREEI
jgi:branched-chain amino acid transport system ATP-binding protein